MQTGQSGVKTYCQEVTHDNYIIRDHCVHNVHIFPGVALLDMIYRLSMSHFRTQAIELRKILFKQPIATTVDFDQMVFATFTPHTSSWNVTIKSQKTRNGVLLDTTYDENLECFLSVKENIGPTKAFDIHEFMAHSKNRWEMEEIYRLARSHDIEHGIFMKTLGHVYQHGSEELMALHLSELAEKHRDKFYAHPAFLDGSTLAGSSFRLSDQAYALSQNVTPYIPLMVDRFCIYKPLPSTIYAYSQKPESLNGTTETPPDFVSTNIRIFSESGEVLVDFEKVTTKRIREPHLIKILIDRKIDTEPIHDVPSKIQTIPEQYVGEDKSLTLYLQREIGRRIRKPAVDIDIQTGFYELGLDSTQLLELVKSLEGIVGEALYPTLLFEYTTIAQLAAYLEKRYKPTVNGRQQVSQMEESVSSPQPVGREKIIGYEPVWVEKELPQLQSASTDRKRVIVLFNLSDGFRVSLCNLAQGIEVVVLKSGDGEIPEQILVQCQQLLEVIQRYFTDESLKEVLIQLVGDESEQSTYFDTFAGMLKTAVLENPKIVSQLIRISSIDFHSIERISELLAQEALAHEGGVLEVYYKDKPLQRHMKTLKEMTLPTEKLSSRFKEQGVYVITGGLGGLGRKVAEHIAKQAQVKLALLGRSKLDSESKVKIDRMIKHGADVMYVETDISLRASLSKAIDKVRNKWGIITGVIHCAGVLKDQFIIKKSKAELAAVFGSKVAGIWNLDGLTTEEDLDFFVIFSSLAAVVGNIGQCDYASANAFLDCFAYSRHERVSQGAGLGKTITVNWPLWEGGGMQVDPRWEKMMRKTSGMKPLPTPLGLELLDTLLGGNQTQYVVMYGEEIKIGNYLRASMTSRSMPFNKHLTLNAAERLGDESRLQYKISHPVSRPGDIAIIGLSGRYPQANTIEAYYQNLKAGKDCIGTIPRARWKDYSFSYDVEEFYRYGGFLEEIDQFDPLFFNISPRQAEQMDPQARLFLEIAWEACEDAGFYQERTAHHYRSSSDKSVGVFVGVFWSNYEFFGVEMTQRGVPTSLGNTSASVANTVSYYLNFHGPSMAVDTMCSSALTSIHLACESVRRGECHYAIAGGVNLVTHPHKYLFLRQAGYLSSDGKSHSFGIGGDGYVPGEGVGALLLTSLEEAKKEGYPIYGVIKGTALNHVGKTSGPTVPDPIAQSEVISDALKDADIDPRTISYVEAHGTGTSLGDPIEITGLSKAFGKFSKDKQFCAIGSVKSNIGHCESAAGVAGLTKVLLQLQHRQLVPSLHSKTLNPNIDFSMTPFAVQQELTEWKRPVIATEREVWEHPRRASVSSFGAGGSNAHVIVEEWLPLAEGRGPEDEGRGTGENDQQPALVVLSAKNEGRLKESAKNLYTYLTSSLAPCPLPLHEVAYTLQVGREAMEERLAILVKSTEELKKKLRGFVAGQDEIGNLYRGQVKRNNNSLAVFTTDEDLKNAMDAWIAKGKYGKLLDLWVKGLSVDWDKIYGETKPRRISLPTYPFARERYWINGISDFRFQISDLKNQLHPLVHENTSNFDEQRFSSTFTGEEFFLKDDVVKGQRVIPEVAYLEMARAAAEQAAESLIDDQGVVQLKNVVWTRSVAVNSHAKEAHIGLYTDGNGRIQYEIYTEPKNGEGEPVIHSQGVATFGTSDKRPFLDLTELQANIDQQRLSSELYYEIFKRIEIDNGSGHQGIDSVYVGKNQALAKLSLPSSVVQTQNRYVLHPTMLDSALHVSVGLNEIINHKSKFKNPYRPFALEALDIAGRCSASMWAWIRISDGSKAGNPEVKLDIDLCDDQGRVCSRMKGLKASWTKEERIGDDQAVERSIRYLRKHWEPHPLAPGKTSDGKIAILSTPEIGGLASLLSKKFPGGEIVDLDTLKSQLDQPTEAREKYGGCVDLIGCTKAKNESLMWVKWLQRLIEEDHQEGLMLLGVTQGLESFQNRSINLSGASRAGLYRMLQSEYSHLRSRHLDLDPAADAKLSAKQIASEFFLKTDEAEVCYRQGKRYRAYLGDDEPSIVGDRPRVFPKDHVLWITGGTRGLGFVCAQHFVKHYGVRRLVLTGRERMPPREQWMAFEGKRGSLAQKIQAIHALEAKGIEVQVLSILLTDKRSVQQSVKEIKNTLGPIGGIIHCAGCTDSENPAFIRKSLDGIQQVLDPKVAGLDILVETFKDEPLQFFVLFSSVSAIIPTLASGQSDYAMANAYMDYVAEAHAGTCPIVSIQWPSWRESGMGEVKSTAYNNTGLHRHTDAEGLELLDHILSQKMGPIVLPAFVNPDRWQPHRLIQRVIQENPLRNVPSRHVLAKGSSMLSHSLIGATQTWLTGLFSEELKIDPTKLGPDASFQDYGVDSILLAQVVTRMDRDLGKVALDPSVLLEYPTMKGLAIFLNETYPEAVASLFSMEAEKKANSTQQSKKQRASTYSFRRNSRKRYRGKIAKDTRKKIAVVGMACHFPDAPNIDRYWENLKAGKDSMSEVPASRWDVNECFQPNIYEEGKSISKWGAFLEDIEYFDPHHFGISEELGVQMDPLVRQWLEVSVEALADAEYDKTALWGKPVGVFAGSRVSNFANKLGRPGKDMIAGVGQNFITALLAHTYNFKGPNMVVDTACSSSLTAIHLGVESLRKEESEIVLAGGVDILFDEIPYITLSHAQVLSPDGRCKTFDERANGIGLGEGCGVLVLKLLDTALEDGNKIYGVIEGSSVNSDGNTMGITTPNPEAQQELLEKAIANAGIDPRTITYVETHGTGTLIGDPIELKGLTRTFEKVTADKQFCGVGSVKSNMGHLLSAAGIAGVIKVLLSMRYRALPPTLHCQKPNPRFNFQDSPLYPVRTLTEWKGYEGVLRGGISAFGLGGNNAHVIISDEGVPQSLRAGTEPRGSIIKFHRKRYWPGKINGGIDRERKQDESLPSHASCDVSNVTASGKEIAMKKYFEFAKE